MSQLLQCSNIRKIVGMFSSYKLAVVNYRWGHLSILYVFLGSF